TRGGFRGGTRPGRRRAFVLLQPNYRVVIRYPTLRGPDPAVDQDETLGPVDLEAAGCHGRDCSTAAEVANLVAKYYRGSVFEAEAEGIGSTDQDGFTAGSRERIGALVDDTVELLSAPRSDDELPVCKRQPGKRYGREMGFPIRSRKAPTSAEVGPPVLELVTVGGQTLNSVVHRHSFRDAVADGGCTVEA